MLEGAYPNSGAISCFQSPVHLYMSMHASSPACAANTCRPRRPSLRRPITSGTSTQATVTMRRSNAVSEIPLPITYTPTTHRISKAKKGKRVHACEFPGCNKVFTRAEHRRRHELNHKPEALYRCTYQNCKKEFHRSDLLTRHMARHEFEAQMESTSQWERDRQIHTIPEPPQVPRCMPMEPDINTYLAATQSQSSMSIGALVGSSFHPSVANDGTMMWNAMDMHSAPGVSMYGGPTILKSVEDTHFYATSDTCPSPASDGTPLSLPPLSRSSIPSTPSTMVESYASSIVDSDLTSSPVPIHSTLQNWDPAEGNFSSMVPITLDESLFSPPITCHYPSPTWTPTHPVAYDDHPLLQPVPFHPMPWKSWTL